jgi:hypothetical protein
MLPGNTLRDEPFSRNYGFDRGGALDRVFIETFLDKHRHLIRGRVLEVHDDDYTRMLGHHLTRVEVLDIDSTNQNATLVADLTTEVPGEYDCVVLTQVLNHVADPVKALRNAYAALAKDGAVLVTVPAIQSVAPEVDGDDYWRFTFSGAKKLAHLAVEDEPAEIEAFGGLASSVASLLGLGLWDHFPHNRGDPRFATIIGFVLRKWGSASSALLYGCAPGVLVAA